MSTRCRRKQPSLMKRKTRRKRPKAVSASELAQMGVCERLVFFEHHYGKRSTASQRAAMARGLEEHERFRREGIRVSAKRGRCYIATLVFGNSWEVMALRAFRDRVLRRRVAGRRLILMYYRTAPAFCKLLEDWTALRPIARAVLRPIAWLADRALRCASNHDA
jgi:hypothetical protein